jgi:rifampicin phosphotransferase
VRARLRGNPGRRLVFFWLVGSCRRRLAARETLRLIRGRLFGQFRLLYLRLGELFVAGGLLNDRRDVMYLTVDEVNSAVRGQSVTQDLQSLIELRRREYDQLRERPMPVRVETFGSVLAAQFHRSSVSDPAAREGRLLTGVPCSPGVVTAEARVVLSPSTTADIDGQILVTVATDPAWVFLMAAAGGLVSETGSVLSHAAIIGRELGIPTVVGIPGVMEAIKDGAALTLDGSAGTVHVLDQPSG